MAAPMNSLPAAMVDTPEFPPPAPPIQRKKKTRELPNLSDCHCCNRRINNTIPKHRLRILTSEWRIVLLCKICYNLVESSQRCSYCLSGFSSSPLSMDSFYQCTICHRRIHRDCVSKFSGPGNSGEFSVCFDCWIPGIVEDDYNTRVCVTKRNVVKRSGDSSSLGSSRVCDSQDKSKSLEVVANESNFEDKEKGFTKSVVERRNVDLSNCDLGDVAVDNKGVDQGGSIIDKDARLAIQLHRAMNSSPRIARNLCVLNTCCFDIPNVDVDVDVNANSDGLQSQAAIGMNSSEKSTNISGDANSTDRNSPSYGELNGIRFSETRQDNAQKCVGTQDKECSNGDSNGCLITYSRRGRPSRDGRCKEKSTCLLRMYSRRLSRTERRNGDLSRCFKTYSRRPSPLSHGKSNLLHGS